MSQDEDEDEEEGVSKLLTAGWISENIDSPPCWTLSPEIEAYSFCLFRMHTRCLLISRTLCYLASQTRTFHNALRSAAAANFFFIIKVQRKPTSAEVFLMGFWSNLNLYWLLEYWLLMTIFQLAKILFYRGFLKSSLRYFASCVYCVALLYPVHTVLHAKAALHNIS